MIHRWIPRDYHISAGKGEVDTNVKDSPFPVSPVRDVDHNPTSHQFTGELLQRSRPLPHVARHARRWIEIAKRNLQRDLHRGSF
jgi:hypothetical protein